MFKVDSVGDGYPCNWPRTCDACHAAACNLYCHTDSAYLCFSCDECIHAANPQVLQHHRVLVCSECENAPAAFTCKADAASLCISCDVEIHSANAIACCHNRVPVSPLTDLLPLPAPMFDVGNETVAYKTNEEIDEAETDSFLLLNPENTENQTNSELMNSEAIEYLEPVEYDSSIKLQYQDEYSQQQSYSAHKGKNISDIIVPVPSVEAPKIQQQQQQKQEQHNISFNGQYEASRAAFINTSSKQFTCDATSINSNEPEAKVLKYREKRKARKFEKKIRYASRKAYAETRPRVRGRFARRTDIELEEDQLFSIEEYGYAIVPSC
nr:zinc finger protein CONSTANS-LIKE 1-like [Quercus suber]